MPRTITAILLFASIMLLPAPGVACTLSEPPVSFRSALSGATAVFVFRLDQAEYKRQGSVDGPYTAWVEGRIHLVQNLYGNPVSYRRITFYTDWCGGIDLVVGHHYLIATSQSGDTIELARADGSVLDIEGFYNPGQKSRNLRSFLLLPVIRAKYGVAPLPESFPPLAIANRTVVQAPPPPPKPSE